MSEQVQTSEMRDGPLLNESPGAAPTVARANELTAHAEGNSFRSETQQQSEISTEIELPIVIAEWQRNAREIIRVVLEEYRTNKIVTIRSWYRVGDELRPGKAGISLSVKHLPALAEAMSKALCAAYDAGLLETGGTR